MTSMAERTRSELEQAAEIVGTIKQFLKTVEDRTAALINEQKAEHILAREASGTLRGQMAQIASDAKAIKEALLRFLQHDVQDVVVDQVDRAARDAGKAQAVAFGEQVVEKITSGTKTNLEGAAKKATAAAVALDSIAWKYTWRGALMAVAIAAGCGLGILLAVAGGVYAYVPSKSEMEALRTERTQLQASIEDLAKHGARLKYSTCGEKGEVVKFCVLIPTKTTTYIASDNPNAVYVVPIGY